MAAERRSLQQRLQIGLLAALTTLLLLLWGATTWTIHTLVEQYLVTRLEHDTEQLLRHVRFQQGRLTLQQNAIESIYLRPGSGHYYVVEADGQRLASPSLNGYHLWTPQPPPDNPYETLGPAPDGGEEKVLVLHTPARIDGHSIHVFVAENHMPIQQALHRFDLLFSLLALITLAGMLLWVRHVLRTGFAPLQQVQRRIARAHQSPHVLDEPLPDLPAEVAPLVDTLRETLGQLHQQLERFRHANADLAHSLKTPLQLLFQQLEDPALNHCPQVRDGLRQQAERLQAISERTLRQARVAGGTLGEAAFSLTDDLPGLIDSLKRLHPDCVLQLDTGPLTTLPLERGDAFELLGNLLDNACKWARHTVWLTLRHDKGSLTLTVEDDGPGVPDAQLPQLGQRGRRLDERRSENGIGLAVVSDIARQYGARLDFSRSAHGGLRVTLTFPA